MKKRFWMAAALVTAASGTATAGTVKAHYTPFQTGVGGEFRIEQLNDPVGSTTRASDVTGKISGNNVAPNGKILKQSPSPDFFALFSKGTTPAEINASNANRAKKDFQTFCIERSETVVNGATYAFSIDTGAINGGNSGGNPDTISTGTAWLFTQFRNDTLPGFKMWGANTTEAERQSSSRSLQHAMWYLEGEIAGGVFGENPNGLNAAEQLQVSTWLTAAANAVTAGWINTKVLVLNLFEDKNNNGVFDGNDVARQSQLTMMIPLPSAGGLACAGFAVVGLRSRRRPL